MGGFNCLVRFVLSLTILLNFSTPIFSYIERPGPRYPPTKGEPWPKPQSQNSTSMTLFLDPATFQFKIVGDSSSILEEAITRYKFIIDLHSGRSSLKPGKRLKNRKSKNGRRPRLADFAIEVLNINIKTANETWPSLEMDESYALEVDAVGTLTSNTVWGALRGLETFSQLIYRDNPLTNDLSINITSITDFPRFPHRGLLLDTSRHYVSITNILKMLDGMAYNKLNVFHWHIIDDQSFPYVSKKFPTLSEMGAYHPSYIYTPYDVQRVVEYARYRGIRVMPEFDTPGHTRSWGVAFPDLLTKCYTNGQPNGDLGPLNVVNEDVYTFMNDLLGEAVLVFPDDYIHLGGDEVDFDCWQSNPQITQYMSDNNVTNYKKLEEVYIQKVVDIVRDLGSKSIVWQEVFLNGVNLPAGTVVHAWTGVQELLLYNITAKGLPALLSTCWYLDHLTSGGDWTKFYECEPLDFPGSDEQKKLVMGGEACMWAEVIDNNNILSRIFPRVSATAEKLWSDGSVNSVTEARFRLEEHYCRMNKRGIPAQPPSGPGYCV